MKKKNYFVRPRLLAVAGLALALLTINVSCSKDDDNKPDPTENKIIMFEGTAKLSSGSVESTATGSVTAEFDPATGKLSYTFTWDGLTGEIGGFHIHKGDGAIIINFKDEGYSTATSGTFSGSSVITDEAWIQDLEDGKLYGQIHTAKYPGGEIIFPFTKKGSSDNGGGSDDGGGDDGGGDDGGYTPPIY